MNGVKSVCNIYVNLTTHTWLLFMWGEKKNQKSRRENNTYWETELEIKGKKEIWGNTVEAVKKCAQFVPVLFWINVYKNDTYC